MVGIKSGMVMQRGKDNTCEIYLTDVEGISSVWYETESVERLSGKALETEKGWQISGIPVGGPYKVAINERVFSDIYVGDVWVLAGQSNMEGVGFPTLEDLSYQGIDALRMLRMNDEWAVANHPLHEIHLAVDDVHKNYAPDACYRINNVGPGLAFIQRMYHMTGVPQGVLCCAHGGTSMAQWSPDLKSAGSASLYGAALRRFNTNGKNVKGMFWYQGCSDANENDVKIFVNNMINLVDSFRNDFGCELPVVQVQISKCVENTADPNMWQFWNGIQERQRTLDQHISHLSTIASIIYPLDDIIHISGEGQKKIGIQGAEAMYHLIYGVDENACLSPPKYASHVVSARPETGLALIEITYANLHGGLTACGEPTGFFIVNPENSVPEYVQSVKLENKTAVIYASRTMEELSGFELYYGYGTNPYCNITDQTGRPIPVMGPIKL